MPRHMRKHVVASVSAVAVLACVTAVGPVSIVARLRAQAPANRADSGVHTLHVQGSVYMLVGAGGNVGLQINDDGVLLVDTGNGRATDQVVAAIRALTDRKSV